MGVGGWERGWEFEDGGAGGLATIITHLLCLTS